MNYRDILGFSKKKKVKKEQKIVDVPQPNKPSVTELLTEEFGPLNEWGKVDTGPKRWSKPMNGGLTEFEKEGGRDNVNEGPAEDYAKPYQKVKHQYAQLWDAVQDFEDLLNSKGLKRHSKELNKNWRNAEKFYKFFFKMMDKLQ